MKLSFWRYAHLLLALLGGIFIFIASVTGLILAFESAYNQSLPFKSADFQSVTLKETIIALKENYAEVFSLSVDKNHFVQAEVIDNQGDTKTLYINPKTALPIDGNYEQSAVFKFSKTLHRSLFMGKTGRILMDITALILFLISFSGVILIIRKQKSWKRFFSKIIKEKFFPHYHTILGRLLLIPVLIISLSGIYMGLETFSVLKEFKPSHQIDTETLLENPAKKLEEFSVFDIPLSQVRKVSFPAFEDIEEFYTIDLLDREMVVNQFTGEIISVSGSWQKEAMHYAKLLHIGRGTVVWAIVLFLSCLTILFFLYSGFFITLTRKKTPIKNLFKKEDCTHIILVGSEGGSTFAFANMLHKEFQNLKIKSFLGQLNEVTNFPKMEQLIVLTSTYGKGDPPSNASKFLQLWQKISVEKPFEFSVVGFGSLAYPDFCKFAFDVQQILEKTPNASSQIAVHTIHNQSFESFSAWANKWAENQALTLRLKPDFLQTKKQKEYRFKVMEKTEILYDETFLVKLQPAENQAFTSGDLLAITSEVDNQKRLYSIGKIENNQVLLSVKRHEKGIVSNFLNDLKSGTYINARIEKNPHFHLPKKAPEVLCIATGTGIAPFLGMIAQNQQKTPLKLVWGGRNEQSFEIYKSLIFSALEENRLQKLHLALSRSENQEKEYVQDVLKKQPEMVANLLKNKGVIMICGSVAMQKAVTELIDKICQQYLNKNLSYFEHKGQFLMDCY